MDKVRIGIIGYGKMGSQHSRSLMKNDAPNAELTAVADIDPLRLDEARKNFGDKVSYFPSAGELIQSGLADAVIPTVPHYLHPEMAIEAFKAGLHVLCEKPAGVYTNQVKAMNEAAEKSGRVFAIMFNQRTNPLYQKARDLVQGGELGDIIRTNWIITNWYRSQSYYDQGGWRATWKGEGGGVLLNQNPHNLDLWQWICGMPNRIKSVVYYGKHRNIEVEDDVYAIAEYPNGATGCYISSVADTPGTNRLEITGDKGKLVIEDGVLSFWRLRVSASEFNKTFTGGIGQPECWKCEIPVKGTYTSHAGIIRNFCGAVLCGEELLSPGYDGIRSLEISNAIHLSSWTSGNWADIPVDGDYFYKLLMERCGN
ncbi:Gfo/Idh/MocA family oxidoreductase [Treponema sp. OttesenSCG-928-L16]|nr:Gfo/Idh/MocA family oxidoreductase [Treponema sp. OttesenSCG-928-L16]